MRPRAAQWAIPGYALVLTLAVTARLLAPGYLLLRDAVSTPRSYLSDAALGLTEAAPRAVPQDFAVAVMSAAVDGGLLVKAAVIAGLFLAGWGAGRLAGLLLPESGWPGQLVATTLAVWNPFVAERLLQGHWSLLVGYGTLPWVAATAVRLRNGRPRSSDWAGLVFWIALAGITPTGLLLATVTALACVATPGTGAPRLRCAAAIVAAATLAAAPWLLAPALSDAVLALPSAALTPFSARAEPGLGTLGSLAGLGGIWNAEAVPHSRTTLFALPGTLLLVTVVAAGMPPLLRRKQADPLLVLAGVGVLVPAALATAPGQALLRALVGVAPGLGVLRDGQKWVALAMPGYTLAAAGAVLTLNRWVRPAVASAVCSAALILALPDLALPAALTPAHYPRGWTAVAATVNAEPQAVAVLPADIMRQFDWAGTAPVLDPLPRWVRPDVLSTGDLAVAGAAVRGEGTHARAVQDLLLAGAEPAELARAGVGWLVVERGTPGHLGDAEKTLRQLPIAYSDADIALYRVGGASTAASPGKRVAMLITHLLWAGLLLGGGAVLATARFRSRR